MTSMIAPRRPPTEITPPSTGKRGDRGTKPPPGAGLGERHDLATFTAAPEFHHLARPTKHRKVGDLPRPVAPLVAPASKTRRYKTARDRTKKPSQVAGLCANPLSSFGFPRDLVDRFKSCPRYSPNASELTLRSVFRFEPVLLAHCWPFALALSFAWPPSNTRSSASPQRRSAPETAKSRRARWCRC